MTTPLEAARENLLDRIEQFVGRNNFVSGRWMSQSVGIPPMLDALIAAAKAEAVEPLQRALVDVMERTCACDAMRGHTCISHQKHFVLEAEARRALSTTSEGIG